MSFLSHVLKSPYKLRAVVASPGLHTTRSVHCTSFVARPPHTADTYSKDYDSTPPADAKIHRVDPNSENVQKPHEKPSGKWSEAGVKRDEYESKSKTEPFNGNPGEGYGVTEGYHQGGGGVKSN